MLMHTHRMYLTSTAVDSRSQGTRLLSEVLTHLHSHPLPQDDGEYCYVISTEYSLCHSAVHYLASFYCDRLKDRVAVLPYVLRGLHAMVGTTPIEIARSSFIV